ncbi:SubName: Full=Uncharacterized protein {ECO:0000313/EMBL:CCA70264.1} [Serendipita indica DSM 11827]|nr:SubName: Full=Uncharacterized protein {ECO:0000313/EMBL:CCA70264.1} [Serendipita indica DSM 11827]
MSTALSDEVLVLIAEDSIFGKRDHLVLCFTSKRLRRIVYPLLYRQIWLRNKGHYFLLRSIVNNPPLGHLIKSLNISWDANYDDDTERVDDPEVEQVLTRFAEVATTRLPESVVEGISAVSESAEVLLLLTLLPQLGRLELSPSGDTHFLETDLFTIIKCGLLSSSLSTVSYAHWDTEGGFDCRNLHAFFFQPSITRIEARACITYDDNDEPPGVGSVTPYLRDLRDFYGQSSVESLCLYQCALSGDSIEVFLRLPKALKCLKYELASATVGWVDSPFSNVGKALSYVSTSLETLIISLTEYDGELDGQETIGSLKGFARLRLLCVPASLLLGDDTTRSSEISGLLPNSLEGLELEAFDDLWEWTDVVECYRGILTSMRADRSQFPALKTMSIGGIPKEGSGWESLHGLAAKVGVSLVEKSIHFSC